MLANLLAIIAGSSLQDSTQCRVGILTDRGVGAILAIIRLEVKFIWREHVAGEAVGKIEGIIVAVNVAVILLTQFQDLVYSIA